MVTNYQKQLLDMLVSQGVLTPEKAEQIRTTSASQHKSVEDVMVSGGFVDEERLVTMMGAVLGIPVVHLVDDQPSAEVVKLLPQKLAEDYKATCFAQDGKKMSIALVDPQQFNAREALEMWATQKGYETTYSICSLSSWQGAFGKYGAISQEITEALGSVSSEVETVRDEEVDRINQVIQQAPVAKIVNLIFLHAVKNKASDIHLEPTGNESRVRYRIDGVLQTSLLLPIAVHDSVIARVKVLARLKIDETRVPQDGRIKLRLNNRDIDVRVATMPLMGQEKVTMRILDSSEGAMTMAELGFSDYFISVVTDTIKKPYGMLLITGPTGSGKSTTLYSILNVINREGVNIATLEDPVEYYTKGVNQAQIRPDVGFTFASGLRALLRQDPDIIMVGEIRDNETAEMAIHAALTGHMLFSTLHTNNAVGSIPRLMDMKVEPFLLASVINAVVAQRLARRVCSKCKVSEPLPNDIQEKIRHSLGSVMPERMPKGISMTGVLSEQRGKGCAACKDTGYRGRVVIAEVLPITDHLRRIITDGYHMEAVEEELKKIGMVSLLQDGLIKVLQGVTTAEEIYRVAAEVEEEF